jgi:hypothetical protein
MKKQNFSALVKKSIFSLGFTGLMVIGLASTAFAHTTDTTPNPTVKYIGSLDGHPLFKVEFANEKGTPFYLSIKDDQGMVLYTEKIKDKQFSKNFRFESDRDQVKLTFTLEGKNGIQSQEFKVNTNTRVLNDVVVTTL